MGVGSVRTRKVEYHVETDETFTDQYGLGKFSPTVIAVEENVEMEKGLKSLEGHVSFWMHRGHETEHLTVLRYFAVSPELNGILREVWDRYCEDVRR